VVDASAGTFSATGAGTCRVEASGAATANFVAASAQQDVGIAKAGAMVALSSLTQTYTGLPLTPAATTVPPGLAIVWTNAPQTNAGSSPVTATVNDANYQGAASGTPRHQSSGADEPERGQRPGQGQDQLDAVDESASDAEQDLPVDHQRRAVRDVRRRSARTHRTPTLA